MKLVERPGQRAFLKHSEELSKKKKSRRHKRQKKQAKSRDPS